MKKIILILLLCNSTITHALDLELTQGINAALPIGIATFTGGSEANDVKNVIDNDLRFSGQFKVIPGYTDSMSSAMWREAGADSVVNGRVIPLGGNRVEVSFTLIDPAAQKTLLTKSYQISSSALRPLAHHISDEIYQKLTGERGIFSTRIAYIVVNRSGAKAHYTLEIADVDGHNPHSLLESSEPIMSPAWSPDGRQISYVSFENKRAQIYTVSVETGQRRLVTNFPGINGAPAWAPNGKELAVVLSKGGAPKIYSVNLSSGAMKQLTFGEAIDTEPRYSPDGRSILFTSGRGGKPQVYRLDLASGQVSRVTYQGNYNARASYTPNQQQIVLLHREDHNFNIGVQNTESGNITTLTFSPLDESPSVSPNGKLILYATHEHEKGVLAVVSIDGRIRMRLPARQGDVQEPSWSPYFG
jgi:TolB protein